MNAVRLLLTNDDGISAPGLWALARSLRGLGEIVVVAPDREQSGVGASFSLHHPIRVRRLRTAGGIRQYAVEGTPADAVILALGHICKDEKIDMVIAGINPGTNLGADIFLSGTVGAALHGHLRGIPAMAISMPLRKRLRYPTAALVARSLVPLVAGGEGFKGILLNVTVPNLPPDQIQGVEVTRLRNAGSTFEIRPGNDGRRDYGWIAISRRRLGRRRVEEPIGTDLWALREKMVSITPLHTDLTAYGAVESMGSLREAVLHALLPTAAPGE